MSMLDMNCEHTPRTNTSTPRLRSFLAFFSTGSSDLPSVMTTSTLGKSFREPASSVRELSRRKLRALPGESKWENGVTTDAVSIKTNCGAKVTVTHQHFRRWKRAGCSGSGAVVTCHGVSALVRQRANRAEHSWAAQVGVQAELHARVAAVLDHAHAGFVFSDLKSARRCRDEAADVFEVGSAHAPRTVHQEQHVGEGASGAFWEKYGGRDGREGSKKTE